MRILTSLILALTMTFAAAVPAADLRQGREYDLIDPAQPTLIPGKIEVIEFFSYACPHCAHLEPVLNAWLKKLPADVEFRRIPLSSGPNWLPTAKLYYTLDALGLEARLHGEVFSAIHGERSMNPSDESSIAAWVAKKGIDSAKFSAAYSSFSVQSKVRQAQTSMNGYGVSGVPAMVVNGRYRIRNEAIKGYEDLMALTDAAIAKVRAERGAK